MSTSQMRYCPNCSALVNADAKFCGNCGIALNWAAQQPGWNPPPPYHPPPQYNQPPPYSPPAWGKANPYWQQNVYSGPVAAPEKSRSRILLVSLLVIALVLIIGGVIFATSRNFSAKPAARIPVVASFTVAPSSITAGQSAILSWDVSGATSVAIDQGIGTVSVKGYQPLSPTVTTTYTITATNSAGSTTATSTVTVNKLSVPVIAGFTAEPATINTTQSATLQWNITGATSVTISPGIGTVSPIGTTVVSPNATTTYTITATNEAGSATATATVTMAGGGRPVIKTFSADPPTVSIGQACILRWSVEGATAVILDHGLGSSGASGSIVVYPLATETYVLTAINGNGDTTGSVTITVK